MPSNVFRDPARSSKRLLLAIGVAVLSLLLHLALLAWLDDRLLAAGGAADRLPEAPVEVSLISRPPPAPEPAPAMPVATPPPRAARVRPARTPTPRQDTITPPAPPAVAVEPVAAGEPLAQVADLPESAESVSEAGRQSPSSDGPAGAPAAEPAASEDAVVAEGATSPRYGTPLPLPPAGHWTYGVFYGDFADRHRVASLDWSIAHDGQRYQLRTEGRAEGLTALLYSGVLSQSSSGRVSADGLAPERYTEQRGKRAERWAVVDAASGQVTFSGGPPVPMQPGAQDRLSVLVQLGLLARAMPGQFTAGQVVEVPELTLRDVEPARYAVHGDATLDTDDGPIRALRLERVAPRKADDPKVEVWLGYDRGMLPVRIRLTDPGGRVLDQLMMP